MAIEKYDVNKSQEDTHSIFFCRAWKWNAFDFFPGGFFVSLRVHWKVWYQTLCASLYSHHTFTWSISNHHDMGRKRNLIKITGHNKLHTTRCVSIPNDSLFSMFCLQFYVGLLHTHTHTRSQTLTSTTPRRCCCCYWAHRMAKWNEIITTAIFHSPPSLN